MFMFTIQIDTLVAQQMEKITKIDFFDELSEKFENNITKKVKDCLVIVCKNYLSKYLTFYKGFLMVK